MLSSVLTSKCAVQVNIAIMRAFVCLREMLASHKDLARMIHEASAAAADPGMSIALPLAGLLDVLLSTPAEST